jgi:hypothetical protein
VDSADEDGESTIQKLFEKLFKIDQKVKQEHKH